MFSRTCLFTGLICIAAGWAGSAQAVTVTTCASLSLPVGAHCFDVTSAGFDANGIFSRSGAVSKGKATNGVAFTDEYDFVIVNQVSDPGSGDLSAQHNVKIKGHTSTNINTLSSFSYEWKASVGGVPNTGVIPLLTTTATDQFFDLPLTATAIPGEPFSYYRLLVHYKTNGSAGGGYQWSVAFFACGSEFAPSECLNTNIPLPPAAILFVSGIAGLGLLGRKRRADRQAKAA